MVLVTPWLCAGLRKRRCHVVAVRASINCPHTPSARLHGRGDIRDRELSTQNVPRAEIEVSVGANRTRPPTSILAEVHIEIPRRQNVPEEEGQLEPRGN